MTDTALAAAPLHNVQASAPAPRRWKLVTHYYPDTDALACLWAAIRFIVKDDEYVVSFVPAGSQLAPEECEGYRVLHMDTGRGELDQHEKSLKGASSFKMLAEKYGFDKDPGIVPILRLTVAADNVEEISRTDVHYVLKGLAHQYRDPRSREVDWENMFSTARMLLEIIYSQAALHDKNNASFKKFGTMITLKNGLKLANAAFKPFWRDAAFEAGADVVLCFGKPEGRERDKDGPFYPLIQCHRKHNKGGLVLDRVIAAVRTAEAKARNIDLSKSDDVWAIGSNTRFGAWMMHDSRRFICCGSRSHQLEHESLFTKLSPSQIAKIVQSALSELLPRN